MKCTNFSKLAVIALLVAATGLGCKKTPQNPTPLHSRGPVGPGPDQANPPITAISEAPPIATTVPPGGGALSEKLKDWVPDPNQPAALRNNTVYFEFDRSDIKASETSKLDAIGSYMKGVQNRAVRVEGHCDERGTEEYNRSLGERRALAAREYLVRGGLNADLIDTISYGEDKPAVPGNNESAWSKNRRAEFILIMPPSGPITTNPQ
ncbi:MAG: OmpA family protein [Verrucomicrobia subdivision 3 bacterium]|nr:OmpA family protein [Limisphaerales bacterium]